MPATEDFWGNILGHLRERVLVAVVGPELLTVADGGRVVTLSRLLGEQFARHHKMPVDWSDRSGLNDAVSAYFRKEGWGKEIEQYRIVNDLLIATKPAPSEALLRLASINDLRLFVSTTFDSLMTEALAKVPGRKLRELWFSPNQSTDGHLRNAFPPESDETVVLKLFGRASSLPQYALHEEDQLEWLYAFLTDTAHLPGWLRSQLWDSPTLFVGCRIPDWLGRFLVRMASRNRLSMASKQFFIVGDSVSWEPELAGFFSTYCGGTRVQVVEMNAASFVAELHQRWRAQHKDDTVPPPATPRGIFLSYAHEDSVAARRLSEAITRMGGDVWLDEQRLQAGDPWDEEILRGIRRGVRLFVPLISKHTERREEGYVFKEWGEALKRADGIVGRRFIVPVVIDADYDGNPERYQKLQTDLRRFQFGHAPDGEPTEALTKTLIEEIRAMHAQEVA